MVLGTPGSGKSYAVINSYIRQCIEKGYALYIYDYKFDDLSTIAYNHLLRHQDRYAVRPQFCVINFDDPRRSNRCNPLDARFMTDISDAYESSYVILLNLNKSWAQKEGDFFSDSAIVLLAAIIWYLKLYDGGRFCTFPHVIELLCQPYEKIFPILASYSELENYLSPFIDAWQNNAQDQLQGQIASAKIPISRIISPQLYWVMTGDDFTLDVNNPQAPKILCVGNNPDRQSIYSAALGLYNSRIIRLTNKKHRLSRRSSSTSCRRYISEGWTILSRQPDRTRSPYVWAFRISRSWNATTERRRLRSFRIPWVISSSGRSWATRPARCRSVSGRSSSRGNRYPARTTT